MKTIWPMLLVLAAAGCQTAELNDAMDRGVEFELEGRRLQRAQEYGRAAQEYTQAAAEMEHALGIAKERKTQVFISFLTTKLAIVAAGHAECLEPDKNPAGSWDGAFERWVTSARWAGEEMMLRLKRNAVMGQAGCVRPDRNPAGSWERAAGLYAEAAALAKGYEFKDEEGEALREQALCLIQGDPTKMTPEARKLLVKARRLGDERAAELLADSGGRFCNVCGSSLEAQDRFCKQCGQDQAAAAPDDRPSRKLEGPGTRPAATGDDGEGPVPGAGNVPH